MKVRFPCQAGAFYAGSPDALKKQLEECFLHQFGPGKLPEVVEGGPRKIVSLVCPHAGYVFSGSVAANAYYQLAQDGRPESIVILGPNHTGYGSAVSIATESVWRMPFGEVQIDSKLANEIQHLSSFIDIDDDGHRYEHSIEVQLPFLQYIYGEEFKLVPISMMMQDLEVSRDVGEAVAKAVSDKSVTMIASTDMTHYEPQKMAEAKDRMAIEAMLKLDEERLQSVVESHNITMCGYGPTSAAIVAAKRLGATKAQLLRYKTSGDITGDRSQVVGYASVAITK